MYINIEALKRSRFILETGTFMSVFHPEVLVKQYRD